MSSMKGAARFTDYVLILWVLIGGIFFFRQFWDSAIPYLARIVS